MNNNNVALLWDESFLWGLMAYVALRNISLPFDLIRAADIQDGVLDHYKMLFIPGGWASNKSRALGRTGIGAIRRFVESGGSYLGFCGGAGLATKAEDGIGLLDVQRKPTRERVPSFSGRIEITVNDHPIWNMIKKDQNQQTTDDDRRTTNVFHAWWPSQFITNNERVTAIAAFGHALPDAFSSDLNVGDVAGSGNWDELEKRYQINLNPERLLGEPAIIEGACGSGKVILSLLHFDTPDDKNGQRVLADLWNYLTGHKSRVEGREARGNIQNPKFKMQNCGRQSQNALLYELETAVSDLISLGERNFLWFWRNAMLLQWRRGVRGLEYNTLYILMKEIAEILHNKNDRDVSRYAPALESIKEQLSGFAEKAKNLLLLERLELQKGPITYIQCDNPEIQRLRKDLFGDAKSHGGAFKEALDEVDGLLYRLLRNT